MEVKSGFAAKRDCLVIGLRIARPQLSESQGSRTAAAGTEQTRTGGLLPCGNPHRGSRTQAGAFGLETKVALQILAGYNELVWGDSRATDVWRFSGAVDSA